MFVSALSYRARMLAAAAAVLLALAVACSSGNDPPPRGCSRTSANLCICNNNGLDPNTSCSAAQMGSPSYCCVAADGCRCMAWGCSNVGEKECGCHWGRTGAASTCTGTRCCRMNTERAAAAGIPPSCRCGEKECVDGEEEVAECSAATTPMACSSGETIGSACPK